MSEDKILRVMLDCARGGAVNMAVDEAVLSERLRMDVIEKMAASLVRITDGEEGQTDV